MLLRIVLGSDGGHSSMLARLALGATKGAQGGRTSALVRLPLGCAGGQSSMLARLLGLADGRSSMLGRLLPAFLLLEAARMRGRGKRRGKEKIGALRAQKAACTERTSVQNTGRGLSAESVGDA